MRAACGTAACSNGVPSVNAERQSFGHLQLQEAGCLLLQLHQLKCERVRMVPSSALNEAMRSRKTRACVRVKRG